MMMVSKMKIVIDTNVLLVSVSQRSSWHWSEEVAQTVIRTLTELSSVHLITTYFRLGLIVNDEDDNKFVDCAFAANADFLVSNDKHFNILNTISFPKINIITLQDFKLVLEKNIE